MRIIALAVLLFASAFGQESSRIPPKPKSSSCTSTAEWLSVPVIRAMWQHDEAEIPAADALGFIRIAVRPAWEQPELFLDIHLRHQGPPTVFKYSLPKGVKTVTSLLKTAIDKNPCANPERLASTLRIEKRKLALTKSSEDVIEQFFALRLAPRRIPKLVRLDATWYEVEFIGDDMLSFASDDHETPMVKWVEALLSGLEAGAR